MRRVMVAVALAFLVGNPSVGSMHAQEDGSVQTDRGPRFLLASAIHATPTLADPARVALLRMRVSADLRDTTIEGALGAISAQTGIQFVYSADVVPLRSRTSLRANGISVAAALTEVLLYADVDVVLSGNQAALVRRIRIAVRQVGTIAGRVTDATTQQGIQGVRVFLEGTRSSATTASTGSYRLTGVAAGAYTLATRRLGYRSVERAVTVEVGQEVTVDVALEPVPSVLDEVVVTVTGEQRLRELGHVVGRINADSLVKEAPVSSLSELLNGRVPGVQVFQNQGSVGGEVRVQIRGPNTLLLNAEPIVIVDGVRHITAGSGSRREPFGSELTSRLNDLNPNDIEAIEIIKGPSAATLYGTDAANGVVVVTTKRGQPGPARWNAYAKGTRSSIPTGSFPDFYWGWGTVFGIPDNTSVPCYLDLLAAGQCTKHDSVTVLPNPLNDPELTIFRSRPLWEYGVNVAGGRQDLRYYFSGDFEDAVGPIQMPNAIGEQLRQERGLSDLPEEWRNPNAFTKLNLRTNVSAAFGETADLRFTTAYVRSDTRGLSTSQRSAYSGWTYEGGPTPLQPYGESSGSPIEAFLQTSNARTDRFFGSASGQWRPLPWLAARATLGQDLSGSNRYSIVRRGDAPHDFFGRLGAVSEERDRQVATTAEVGVTATLRRGPVSARTAVGAQYVRNVSDLLFVLGYDMPPGGTSVGEAVFQETRQRYAETVTFGGYVEETVGLNERLFLTGALRADGASTFGRGYDAALYPKVSVSWLTSEEAFLPRVPALNELRLRYAFGISGQQPTPTMALPGFSPARTVENGTPITIMATTGLGNPELRPERVQEHEFGFDATIADTRLQLEFTWYRRRTADQIITASLPPGLGSAYTNLGLTTQRGFEAGLTARVLDTRLLTWDVMLQHGSHTTKLVDLGTATALRFAQGGYVEGYPLGARFQNPVLGYTDANGDGIIVRREVQLGDTAVYVGQSTPPRSQTLTAVLGVFERRLRVSALLERRSGFTQINALTPCYAVRCRARVDPSTPLGEQVEALLVPDLHPEPADFTRLREITASVDLPLGLTRALRVRSAVLALSARNLALWTDFSGPDPESATAVGWLPISGALSAEARGMPQARSWTLRLDLGL
jgi:TonB-dependent SusC/RagA subfamily outer membrane receptor